jgi:transposase
MDSKLSVKILTYKTMSKNRNYYDPEFKRMAVELAQTSDKCASEVARELGIKPDLVCRWTREYLANKEGSFSGQGNMNLTPEQREIAQLKKELQEVKIERDILKKAVSIFSRSDGKSTNS